MKVKNLRRIKFKYDSENDVYICPEGKKLYRETQKRQKVKRKNGLVVEYVQYRCRECKGCENREICCRGKIGRKITRVC